MKKFNKSSIVGLSVASLMLVLSGMVMAATAVDLGAADSFAILAGASVTNVPTSVITGNVGLSPAAGSNITGGVTQAQVTGTIYTVSAGGPAGEVVNPTLLTAAKSALTTAYTNAANAVPPTQTVTASSVDSFGPGTVNNGADLVPGIYKSPSSIGVTGTLTLNGGGDPNAVFIFQAASTLTTASASVISLTNSAQACNVFWQVGSSAAQLGANSFFKGTLLSDQTITLLTGVNVEGRLLAFTGSVILDQNIVTKPTCVTPPPAPVVPGTGSGSSFSQLPLINITKLPNPLNLPGGAGSVTYTYVTRNIGKVAMSGVWVNDDKCSAVTYVTGDANGDSKLDTNEAWIYRCTKTVSKTETNTATARGFYNGWDTYDTASATVVVGASLTPPLIHVEKRVSASILPAGGGAITYFYSVTNPGTAPLHTVSVIDNKCTGLPGRVIGHPGDLNKNNLLENNETWQFTCQSNITKTTTNIVTAEGHANGLTAIDFSQATVYVGAPGLPNTGLPPENNLWNIFALAGILTLISASLALVLRKRTI